MLAIPEPAINALDCILHPQDVLKQGLLVDVSVHAQTMGFPYPFVAFSKEIIESLIRDGSPLETAKDIRRILGACRAGMPKDKEFGKKICIRRFIFKLWLPRYSRLVPLGAVIEIFTDRPGRAHVHFPIDLAPMIVDILIRAVPAPAEV